ncbi:MULTISPECIES: ankyrin repeat domain-containing protein [Bacillus cereus group]|uniref:ankyrin repeat domain-containing protein n=1 Tax=Bacillus cereus group TaxID=86661 RepID=UPI0022E0586B|nr:ankyrin repeat domain-containing protein [Bacillus cereus group sp. TH152-1LC]MDA1675058.1 ankyrin repeat domain-containing protein [Bacillus cereus group sp. TH152-1LC]
MSEKIHEVDSQYAKEFIKLLTPIADFSIIPEGTKIFSSHSQNPLFFDTFIKLEHPGIKYISSVDGRIYTFSAQGWYFWDEETAFNILSSSIDKNGRSLFVNGIIHERQDIIDFYLKNNLLLDIADYDGKSPFYYAANTNNHVLCKQLLEKGVDVNKNSLDNYEQTALHAACFLPSKITAKEKEEAETRYVQTISLLLELGYDVNAKDTDNDTPLITCCHQDSSNHKPVELLLNAGAEVNVVNVDRMSPLHYAVVQDHVDIANLLLENNAIITTRIVQDIKSENMVELFEKYITKMDEETEIAFRINALKIALV